MYGPRGGSTSTQVQSYVDKYKDWKASECGLFKKFKAITTKRGDRMAFGTFSTYTDDIECVMFPETYRKMEEDNIINNHIVYFISEATPSLRNGKVQLIVDKIEALA